MINNLQSILTQDHLATEAPIYLVYSQRNIAVDNDSDYDKLVFVRERCGEYEELDWTTFAELESAYLTATDWRAIIVDSKGNQVDSPIPKDPFDDDKDFDPSEWKQKMLKTIDVFEQAFFIRKNAEDFIESQSHKLSNPRIYVESAYRNPEWQQIRELLIAAAKTEQNQFGQLKLGLKYRDIVDGMWVVYSELPYSNYANSLKRTTKTGNGWMEETLAVESDGKYANCQVRHCFAHHIWDEKCYAPVSYDEKAPPAEFMDKILPLSIKGEID